MKDVFELFSKDKDKNLLMPGDLQMALQCVGIKQSDRDNLEKKLKEESGGNTMIPEMLWIDCCS